MKILETLVSVALAAFVPLFMLEIVLTISMKKGVDYYFECMEKYEKRKAARPEKNRMKQAAAVCGIL